MTEQQEITIVIYTIISAIHWTTWFVNYTTYSINADNGFEVLGKLVAATLWAAFWPIFNIFAGLMNIYKWARDI